MYINVKTKERSKINVDFVVICNDPVLRLKAFLFVILSPFLFYYFVSICS